MALTQERMIAMITLAIKQAETIDNMRNLMRNMAPQIFELIPPTAPELKEQFSNFLNQMNWFSEPNWEDMQLLANEKAYFNSARIRYNLYMRDAQRKYKTKQKLKLDPLDLGLDIRTQNNVAKVDDPNDTSEVPMFLEIEEKEKLLKERYPNLKLESESEASQPNIPQPKRNYTFR